MSADHRLHSLTPREREVLGLVRRGLTNEEIAQRLGITLDGAKYHVSQIISKLGVSSREEAAALAEERRTPWTRRFAPIAAVVTLAAALAGIGVLTWGVLRTEGNGNGPDFSVDDPAVAVTGGPIGLITFIDSAAVEERGFTLTLPEGTMESLDSDSVPPPAQRFDLPIEPGTTLGRKYVEILWRVSEECRSPWFSEEQPGDASAADINGHDFFVERRGGAWTGHYTSITAYSTARGSDCVSLTFVLDSTDQALYPSPPPEYDREAEAAVFGEIAASLRWLGQ